MDKRGRVCRNPSTYLMAAKMFRVISYVGEHRIEIFKDFWTLYKA